MLIAVHVMPSFDILQFSHDSEALETKLPIFHESVVSQYPEDTWAQGKPNQI